MPRLDKTTAAQVEAAESADYEPLPSGTYHARLQDVTVREGRKAPYWSWEFKITEEGYTGRRVWVNTSLADAAAWKMREVFDAFGAPPETDTDELCGRQVRLLITQRVIESGKMEGQIGNNVNRVMPVLVDVETTIDEDDLF